MNTLDHVNVKIFATPDTHVHWDELIPVFHSWIQKQAVPGSLIDVTDYSHVPDGPGVLLIGHEGFYSVDNRTGNPGVLYNRRTSMDGNVVDKVRHSYELARTAARLLETESKLSSPLRFDEKSFEVFVNDRALGPNNEETEQTVAPAVEALYQELFGQKPQLERDVADKRGLFRLRVKPSE